MKHIVYEFTDQDVDTCLFALSQLDLLYQDDDVSDLQISINEACAASAIKKLCSGEQLLSNELRVLCCCITCCNMVCQGSIASDKQVYDECIKYAFSLNKLDQELSSQLI